MERLAIVCGGTGGHFYPGLSIAIEFKGKGGHPMLFLSGRNAEEQARTASAQGIDSRILPAQPPPKGLAGRINFIIHSIKGIFSTRSLLKEFSPQALLAMGSFHSAAPAVAARTRGIPVFIHDGNARVGKANLFLSKFSRHMALSFPPVNAEGIKCKWTVTGMPVRQNIASCNLKKAEAISQLNTRLGSDFSTEMPLILVFGGSQGAEGINQKMPEALKMQGDEKFQLIHISGAGNREKLEKAYADSTFKFKIIESSPDMEIFYSAADLVICRSGGSTVAELSIFAKFAILIPYPYATDSHQDDNADFYCSSGAGIKILEKELSVNKLASTIAAYLEKPAEFAEKASGAKVLARPDASSEILQLIDGNL